MLINLRRILIEKKLEITEARKPKRIEMKPTSSNVLPAWLSLSKVAPSIAGIKIKNENFAAFIGSTPNIRRKEIVIPEREIPGSIDNPWKTPI